MNALLLILRVFFAIDALAVFALLSFWAGPDAEATLAPVIVRQRVGGAHRLAGGAVVCWAHHFGKARPADPYDANWTMRGDGRIFPFQRAWRVDENDRAITDLVPRPVEDDLVSYRCAEIPEALRASPIRITGYLEYRTPQTGWLWTVRQPTPEVEVP